MKKELKCVNGKTMKSNNNNRLDEYFTKRDVSKRLIDKTKEIISKYDDLDNYIWIEPSVGDGSFYDNLPQNKIGVDIMPKRKEFIQCDYLSYQLPHSSFVVIGNPPFGNRGVLALEFIEHSIDADYVAFILPMFFQSIGKGSIRYRVKGFNLLYEEKIPDNSFYLSNGKDANIRCCFQIWSKKHKNENKEYSWYNNKKDKPFSDIIEAVTISLAKNRECGKKWIYEKKANYYISSSYFKTTKVVKDFKDVNYKSGVAIIYKTDNQQIIKQLDNILENADWEYYSTLATNGCRHIGKSNIYKLLDDKLNH